MALGLLQFVSPTVKVAYIDTPALFSVVAALSDHLRAFGNRYPIFVENFSSYAGYANAKFDPEGDTVVIISTSSSGGLAKAIMSVETFTVSQIIHLLYLGPKSEFDQTVCDLSRDRCNPEGQKDIPLSHSSSACSLCDRQSIAVPLVGDNFEFPGPQPVPLSLRVADLNLRSRRFLEHVVGKKVLRVGFGRSNEPMARQFEISAEPLLGALDQSGHVQYALRQAIPLSASAIIALDSQSVGFAGRVREEIQRVRGSDAIEVLDREMLPELTPRTDSGAVLVIGAVIESGRSLQEVSRDLRRPYPAAPQVYLIGVAKYRSDNGLSELRSNLVQTHSPIPHEFVPLEAIQLPSSAEPNAWISELAFLADATFFDGMKDDEVEDWVERRDRLRRQSEPLINELFVPAVAGKPLRLQSGFAFWPEFLAAQGSQADVFFTMASVVQSLRARADDGLGRALRADLFQQTLLAPQNFGRFSDGVIQACLLRALRPAELNYSGAPDLSREMSRYARRMVENASKPRGEAAAELLIALATRRLQLRPDDYAQVISPFAGLPPRVERLRLYLERMLT